MELAFRRLADLAATTPRRDGSPGTMADDPLTRDRLARLWGDVQALRFTIYRAFSAFLKTGMPGPEGSIAKLFWSDRLLPVTTLYM